MGKFYLPVFISLEDNLTPTRGGEAVDILLVSFVFASGHPVERPFGSLGR